MLSSQKDKLASGRSYPMKTSLLDAFLADVAPDLWARVVYSTWGRDGDVFAARYLMPNCQVHHRRLFLGVRSVPSAQRAVVQQSLIDVTLPALAVWLRQIHGLPHNATVLYERPSFHATFLEGELRITARPKPERTQAFPASTR